MFVLFSWAAKPDFQPNLQNLCSRVVHDSDSICLSPIILELNRKSGDLKVPNLLSLVGRDKQVEGRGCTQGRRGSGAGCPVLSQDHTAPE